MWFFFRQNIMLYFAGNDSLPFLLPWSTSFRSFNHVSSLLLRDNWMVAPLGLLQAQLFRTPAVLQALQTSVVRSESMGAGCGGCGTSPCNQLENRWMPCLLSSRPETPGQKYICICDTSGLTFGPRNIRAQDVLATAVMSTWLVHGGARRIPAMCSRF